MFDEKKHIEEVAASLNVGEIPNEEMVFDAFCDRVVDAFEFEDDDFTRSGVSESDDELFGW